MVSQASEEIARQYANAAKNKKQWGNIVYNVRDYGAEGDGVHDDSDAFQEVADLVTQTGGTIYIPPGHYKIGKVITICFDLNIPQYAGKGINIRGDNSNSTVLINSSASDYIFYVYETFADGRATQSFFHMQDLCLTGTLTNKGLHMLGISEQYIENVVFTNLFVGLQMEDVVRCRFVSCSFSQNKNGLYAMGQINISTPNAIDFLGTCFYGNSQAACYFKQGCNVNFFGGTIETNGYDRSEGNTWGARFDDCGRYGGAGANFYGVYFEGNGNVADVWINHTLYPATYSFHGCTFNKFAPPKDNMYNIRVDAGSFPGNGCPAKVMVTGCAFRDMSNTPSSTTPYIKFFTGGTPVLLEQYSNYFQSDVELPSNSTPRIYASAKLVNLSTTPVLFKGINIDTIFKHGTGDYTINFLFASAVAQKITTASMDILGFTQVTTETTTSIRIKTYNTSGVPVDPGTLMFMCLE